MKTKTTNVFFFLRKSKNVVADTFLSILVQVWSRQETQKIDKRWFRSQAKVIKLVSLSLSMLHLTLSLSVCVSAKKCSLSLSLSLSLSSFRRAKMPKCDCCCLSSFSFHSGLVWFHSVRLSSECSPVCVHASTVWDDVPLGRFKQRKVKASKWERWCVHLLWREREERL